MAYEKCFPLIKISRKRYKDKKWITPGLIKSSEKKCRLYKIWIKTRKSCDRDKYLAYQKIYNKILKVAESNYYKLTFDSKLKSTKSIWREINKLCYKENKNRNHISRIPKLVINNKIITEDKEMTNEFNQYFSQVGVNLASKLPPVSSTHGFKRFLPPSVSNSFVCDSISYTEIQNTIKNLKSKNSSGSDMLNAKLIQEFCQYFIGPLHYIFNLSIQSGVFPSLLKIAKILPIYKKGDHSSVCNYRPISLLNTFGKILESIVSSRLNNYLTKYDIFYKYQFGFRHKYSTKLALLDSVDDIFDSLDKKQYVAAIFFDLSKAFDSLDRDILLHKLYNYGIRGPMHSWLKSYLSNRSQYVILNNAQSTMLSVDYGVPQGSVLGPLLFLLYINDIGNIPNLPAYPKIFADDTNIFINASNLIKLNRNCQDAIDRISDWMLANRLTVNYEKTNYMIFSPNKQLKDSSVLELTIDNFKIKKVTSIKYLGIYIDENLNWKTHIQDLCQSLRKYVGIFYKLSLKLPQKILKILYFTLVYSRILYAVEIYANTYITYLHDLMIINNRILRILQHKPIHTSTIDLYRSFNTLPVDKLFQYQILLHAHAIYFHPESVPTIFLNNNKRNNEIHAHNTRASQDFHKVSITSIFGKKLSSNVYAKLWNLLPIHLKTEINRNVFKTLLKVFLASHDLT